MFSVKSVQTIENTIKKSRFIAVITPCCSENEVLRNLRQTHSVHPNATHIAFAYRIKTDKGFISRFHDAGEPNGTAGKPIYQHLEGKDLINILIVVIRYFGGIKLGAGGLTRAYGNSAKKVIEAAEITDYIEYVSKRIKLDYKQLQTFEHQLKKLQGTIEHQDFAEQVELIVSLPENNISELARIIPH